MATAIAVRYARALADVTLAPGSGLSPQDALKQLHAFEQAFSSSEELQHILLSPAVSTTKKRAVIQAIAARLELHPLVRNLLWALSDRRRTALIGQVSACLESALDEKLGQLKAEVRSASPLEEDLRVRLRETLSRMSGKKVRCEFAEEPELAGGILVRMGSKVFDGSVRGRLEAMRRQLAAEA